MTGHGELVADLGLAGSELTVQLRDASRFNPSCAYRASASLPILPTRTDGPPSMLSSAVDPVVMVMRSARRAWLEQSRQRRACTSRHLRDSQLGGSREAHRD